MSTLNTIKNIIFFVIYLILNPKLIIIAASGIYIPVYLQFTWLNNYKIKTIIDIGAHNGRTTQVFNYLFPKAVIYAFEPIPKLYNIIKSKITNKNVHINQIALSDRIGFIKFNIYAKSQLSSILKIVAKNNIKKVQIKVKTTTLDNFFKNIKLEKPIFLKIDTQGTEKLILGNGLNLLRIVDIIHIETTYNHYYEKEPLFDEVYNFLVKRGFKYKGQISESYFYPHFSQDDRVNSIFIKDKHA